MASKILTLMGFDAQTAGGLMVPEYVALAATASATDALGALRGAAQVEGAAATSVNVLDQDGRLIGAVPLASLVKTDPQAPPESFVEPHPVHVHPNADVVELAIVMSENNLVLVPVTDIEHRLLGVVTVDDVLETTIPEDWRRRGPAVHPGT